MSYNLPPGVSVNDIPGNRPEDIAWDDLVEWLGTLNLTPHEIRVRLARYQEILGAAKVAHVAILTALNGTPSVFDFMAAEKVLDNALLAEDAPDVKGPHV